MNKPAKSLAINSYGAQYIVIGTQAWLSNDGVSWTPADPTSSSMIDFLPSHDYQAWFDANALSFTAAGEETKNGIDCIHYKGAPSLSRVIQVAGAAPANLQADLWIAKNGSYPVSGVFGVSGSNGQSGGLGFHFDITNINDASNKVTQPTNIIAIPS